MQRDQASTDRHAPRCNDASFALLDGLYLPSAAAARVIASVRRSEPRRRRPQRAVGGAPGAGDTSEWRALIDAGWRVGRSHILAGASSHLQRSAQKLLPAADGCGNYGPTETTVWSTLLRSRPPTSHLDRSARCQHAALRAEARQSSSGSFRGELSSAAPASRGYLIVRTGHVSAYNDPFAPTPPCTAPALLLAGVRWNRRCMGRGDSR